MKVTCRCASCKASYQVSEEYLGRKIKCPKCSAAILVAAEAKPAEAKPTAVRPAAAKPAETKLKTSPVRPAETRAAEGHAASAPLVMAKKLAPQPPPIRKPAVRSPSQSQASESGPPDLPGMGAPASFRSSIAHHPKRKRRGDRSGLWIALGLGAGGLVLVLVFVAAFMLSGPKVKKEVVQNKPAKAKEKEKEKEVLPINSAPPGMPRLEIVWQEWEREGASVAVDGRELPLPKSGQIKYPLPPRSEPYHFRIERPGYKPIEFARRSAAGEDQLPYSTENEWVKKPRGFDDWLQDFEEAKQLAGKNNKQILILFDGSDWVDASRTMAKEIFSQPDFRDRTDRDYVLVYADFPHSAEAKGKVKNPDRNKRLQDQFGVGATYPAVVVTNKDGQPLGMHEGNVAGGLKEFTPLLDDWNQVGYCLKDMAALNTITDTAKKQEAVRKALDALEDHKLNRFYSAQIKEWLAMLPPEARDLKRSATDAELQQWFLRFRQVGIKKDEAGAAKVVGEFDEWKKKRKFDNHDLGATLHIMAAELLLHCKKFKEAAQECQDGLSCGPTNQALQEVLKQLHEYLGQAAVEGFLLTGVGTGFCVAPGGYVLTNHHVIHEAKKIKVRIAGLPKPVPATLVPGADDAKGDMALLKVDLPAGTELPPVLLVPKVETGESICALGFPHKGTIGENMLKANLSMATGVVMTAPDPDNDQGTIDLDCRINHGNSGGPLCNNRGVVLGMVFAKSFSSSDQDSVGMAIPAAKLQKFLKKYLPSNLPASKATPSDDPLEWKEVRARMEKSIVRVENMQ
jgi:S1-C subfamily serine protease/DNA-directed RNA polymerase subunit RPC12/RpoP